MFIMIVATLNLVLGYWLGICVHEDARDQRMATIPTPSPAREIIAQPSALPRAETAKPTPAPPAVSLEPQPAAAISPAKAVPEIAVVSELSTGLNTFRPQLAEIDS